MAKYKSWSLALVDGKIASAVKLSGSDSFELSGADLIWSNANTFDGGSEGVVHGVWGGNLKSVHTTVPVPPEAKSAVISLRYWALDSWDSGEVARVLVNEKNDVDQT